MLAEPTANLVISHKEELIDEADESGEENDAAN